MSDVSAIARVAKMDKEFGKKPKQYEQKCKVCDRNYGDVLLKGQMIVGCPTNDLNHHAVNDGKGEEKPGVVAEPEVKGEKEVEKEEKPKKPVKKEDK